MLILFFFKHFFFYPVESAALPPQEAGPKGRLNSYIHRVVTHVLVPRKENSRESTGSPRPFR